MGSAIEEVFKDTFNLLCGEKIGEGIHRVVYECKLRPDLVVKVEDQEMRFFANIMESTFWAEHEYYKPVSKWLAPCEFVSPDGRILLQKKCDKLPQTIKLPEKLPAFLTDIKRSNFGLLNGHLVCVDYSLTIPSPSTRLRKVDWC